MMKKSGFIFLSIVFLVSWFNFLFSQDKEFASRIISDITSPEYHGRGYQYEGINLSAAYIINVLKNIQVQHIYEQKVSFPVSYIKKIKKIAFDGKEAVLGDEVIIYPNSSSINGTFSIEKIDKNNFKEIVTKDFTNKFILFDTSLTEDSKFAKEIRRLTETNSVKARGFIICKSKKLMQVQADETYNWITLEADAKFVNAHSIQIHIQSRHKRKYTSLNIIGIIPGELDSMIVFTAHYDHMGRLGNVYFPGANDNASGVAMALDIGRELAIVKNKYTIVLMFFTGEEVGLTGSTYFVENPLFDLSKIKYLFNLDVIGSGEKGITIVNGTEFKELAELLKQINEKEELGLEIKLRGVSNNSDHAPFYEKGVKAVFIYAMGQAGPYHNPEDVLKNLSLAKYNEIVKLLLTVTKY